MNFTFENQGTNTYLVYQVGEDEEIDSMSLGMITNNKILGLAPTVFFQQDTTKYFKYNVSAKVSADQFLMGTVTKKRIIGVFSGIVNAMISAEEYMIDTNSICLDMEHIYTDVSTCETILICLPVFNLEKPPVDLKSFFKNIVFSTQFDQTENCDYIAKLINYLNSASSFSLEGFKELLETIDRGVQVVPTVVPVQPVPQPVPQQVPVQPVPQPVPQQAPVQPIPQPMPQQKPVQSAPTQSQPATNSGFAIPGQSTSTPASQPVAQSATPSNGEKEMSWLYLMQHYSKENAAIYKAQQDAKKAAKANAAPVQAPVSKQGKKEAGASSPGFAIPGQPAPAPTPQQKPVQPTPQPAPYSAPQAQPQLTPTQMALQLNAQQAVSPAQTQTPTPAPMPIPEPVVTPTPSPMNFGETTILSGGGAIGETTVLGASSMVTEVKPYLVRSKNNEKILLDKPVFRIGKEKSYVDYFIGDNTAISRSHANIVSRDGEYFVVDTNSTNHTYLNGAMLQSNVEAKISHGARLKLANEEFEFRIY